MRTDEMRIAAFRAIRFNLYLNYNRKVLAITKKVTNKKADSIRYSTSFAPMSAVNLSIAVEKHLFRIDVFVEFIVLCRPSSVYVFVDKVLLLVLDNTDD